MKTKQTPVNFRTYYKLFIEQNKTKRDELIDRREKCINQASESKKNILADFDTYKSKYNINLNFYKEFVAETYLDGTLNKLAKGLYYSTKDDYVATAEALELYMFSNAIYEIRNINKELEFVNKCCILSIQEYTKILKVYYNKVQELMILKGYGYDIEGTLGWLCINRCKKEKGKQLLNFAATRRKEQEIIKNGGRVYNKVEAEWCKKNGLEYKYEDKRVFLELKYVYEVAWIKPTVKNASMFKFEVSDYRGKELRGLTNEEIKEKYNNDLVKICNLPLDIKTKLMMCIDINKKLYFKFIRNETQKSVAYKQIDR